MGGERVQAGRLFNSRTEGHERDARATIGEWERGPYMFLRNEPDWFWGFFPWNHRSEWEL